VNQEAPRPPRRHQENDPYPKMIIVCIVISAVLFVVIMGVLLFDFIERGEEVPGFVQDPSGVMVPGFPPIPEPQADSPDSPE